MDEQPRRLKYRQGFEKMEKEKKPGFWERIFGKKSRPEVKPDPHVDNSIETQLARNKLKEAATQMAVEHLKDFKEKKPKFYDNETRQRGKSRAGIFKNDGYLQVPTMFKRA